jgi:ABC-type lipoprotein release transport system permease subunit
VTELGVRVAMGATPGDVLRLVAAQGLRLCHAGLAAGVAGALALTRLMSGMLYGVTPTDPTTFAAVVLLLSAVAMAASTLPARRAVGGDPLKALRSE